MPVYTVTAPNGQEYDVTAPEGATQEQVLQYAKDNYATVPAFQQQEITKPVYTDVPTDESLANAIPMPTTKDKIKKLIFGDYTPEESIKRQLGLTGRSALKGATALADIAAMPVRGALNLALPEDKQIPEMMLGETIANKLNLPVPKSTLEKIVGKAVEYTTGAGSAAPLKYIKPTTTTGKAIQESLIENMPLQIASGAAAGTAVGAAEERGAGVLGQTSAALGAGVLPFIFSKGKQKPVIGKQTDVKSIKKSEDLLQKYEIESAEAISRGVPIEEVRPFVNKKMGIDDAQINQAAINKDVEIPIPKTKIEADSLALANRVAEVTKLKTTTLGQAKKMLQDFLQPIDTRLNKYFPNIYNKVRKNSINEHIFNEQYLSTVKPFMQVIKSLPEDLYKKVTLDLFNGNFTSAKTLLKDNIGENAAKQLDVTTNLLKILHKNLTDVGFEIGEIQNYFPRGSLKDLDGFYNYLETNYGYKAKGAIEKALNDKAIKLNVSIDSLPEEETAKIINSYLKGYRIKSERAGPSFVKERKIDTVKEDMLPFFNDPVDSLDNYIRSVVSSIEDAKFFGKNNLKANGRIIDTETSVGNLLARDKTFNQAYLDEASSLLRARFNAGKQSPHKIIQVARDLTYMATLGNPIAALTQLGDTAISVIAHGFKNTIADAFGANKLTVEKMGFDNITAEFTKNQLLTSKYLDKILSSKLVQFKNIDKFGKNKNINGAINKAKKLLSTKQGEAQLKSKYGGFFGDNFDQFAADLKRDVFSPDVKAYSLMELADVQPIFLESLPRIYLQNPNGRIAYALQSFTLKQLDYMNRTIRHVWKSGNKKEALKQAIIYYSLIVGANTGVENIKKIALGREIKPEDIPVDAFFNLAKMFGISKYTAQRSIAQGDIAGVISDVALSPPSLILFTPLKDIWKAITEDDVEKINSFRMFPSIGPFLYEWFGGGREAYQKQTKDKNI